MTDSALALASLWSCTGLPMSALDHVRLDAGPPLLPSSFAVTAAAQASIAASALAAANLWQRRGGAWQTVTVPAAHAVAEFRSERYLRVNGELPADPWDKLAGIYRCGDGIWVRIHTNFAHHRDGILQLLGCANERESVAAALSGWQAEAFECACAERGLVVAMQRSFEEWDAHPQGQAVASLPVFDLVKIGDAPRRELPAVPRPLDGIRVLDLTRIIAGPVGGRTLAAHGADVLNISSPALPNIPTLLIDTGRGKRSAQLDLNRPCDADTLRQLIAGADVFMQGYRPDGLAERGFSPATLAAARPGIVCASLSAYGHVGPWAGRRGFDSLVQTAAGFNHAEAQAAGKDQPQALPAQVLDHAAGYLLALGVMAALARQMDEGGSWHVRVSLAQTAHWLRSLGRVADGFAVADQQWDDVQACMQDAPSAHGALRAVSHAAQLPLTPPRWDRPSAPPGSSAACW